MNPKISLEDLPLADIIAYLEALPPNLPYSSLVGVPAGTQAPSIIEGQVSATGSVIAGTGFSVTRLGVGTYRIDFSAHFSSAPVVVLTPMLTGGVGNYALPGVNTVIPASVTLNTVDPPTLASVDCAFHFLAISPT